MATIALKQKVSKMLVSHPTWKQGDDGARQYKLPTHDGKECEFALHLVGQHSPQFMKASREAIRNRGDDWGVLDLDDENTHILSQCIVGWDDTGFIDEPFSPEGALQLLTDNKWIADQVQVAIADKQSFFE